MSTISTCVGGVLLLTSKKYKKKLLKCYELLDKITSSLATFEVSISLSVNPFMVFDCHVELGHSSWNAASSYMENAVKLFSQVHTAQSFQVNIEYYANLSQIL